MHRFFVEDQQVKNGAAVYLENPSDVKHLTKVLRAEVGEKIEICDASGNEYICEIEEVFKDQVVLGILEKKTINRESPVQITLFQGLPKADKMELIVQKAVELGALSVVPVTMDRCVAKLGDAKDAAKKVDRWQKIADEAAKQSKRSAKFSVTEPTTLKQLINDIDTYDLFLVPYELESTQGIKAVLNEFALKQTENAPLRVGILIGPEGGISDKELDLLLSKKATSVTLGPRILRTETAGLTTIALVQFVLGDLI